MARTTSENLVGKTVRVRHSATGTFPSITVGILEEINEHELVLAVNGETVRIPHDEVRDATLFNPPSSN